MANDPRERWVLADQHGNYYVLTPEALERARVPESEKPTIEARLRAQGDDTTGYSDASLASTSMQAYMDQWQRQLSTTSQLMKASSTTTLVIVGTFK